VGFTGHLSVYAAVSLLISAFAAPLVARWRPVLSGYLVLAALVFSFITSVFLLKSVIDVGTIAYFMGGWAPPWGIELIIDPLRAYMLVIVTGISLWIFIYALRDLEHELKEEVICWYHSLYAILTASMAVMALTNDLFNLFVMMEICAITACALITIKRKSASKPVLIILSSARWVADVFCLA